MAKEPSAKEPSEEFITIDIARDLDYRWKVGRYLSRFNQEMRDNKRLVANRCPKCGMLYLPPQMVCGRCHVRAGEEFIELSDKGTVTQYSFVVQRLWDPVEGKWFEPSPYPGATILLDGGVYTMGRLEETDMEKIHRGMRVEAVWKEKKERGLGTHDILYWRTIEE